MFECFLAIRQEEEEEEKKLLSIRISEIDSDLKIPNCIIWIIRMSELFGSADLNLDSELNSDSDLNLTPD